MGLIMKLRNSKKGAGQKPAPLTTAQKQSRRRAALDEIAQASGWDSWDQYATAVKRGIVVIVARPNPVLQPTTPVAKISKSRISRRCWGEKAMIVPIPGGKA
jgi:hypothetical protein